MSVFSPLALTQTLPFLPLAQGDIDYEVARRGEPDLFAKVLAEPATKVILVKDGKVAVPHGQGAIADYANVKMRLAQLPGAYVAAELESHPSALAIFLGSYGGRLGEHVVAVDTEFLREKTYFPKLCLIQVGTADEVAAIDPILVEDLSPLAAILSDARTTKVFHACTQDLEVILEGMGCACSPVWPNRSVPSGLTR